MLPSLLCPTILLILLTFSDVIECVQIRRQAPETPVSLPPLQNTAVSTFVTGPTVNSELKCYMCQNMECTKQPKLISCSKEKMSEMNLVGPAKTMWNLLVAGAAQLDDPAKNTECFLLGWDKKPYPKTITPLLRMLGCAPAMVGNKDFCTYANETGEKNNYVMRCKTFKSPGYMAAIQWKQEKKCHMCQTGDDCLKQGAPKIMTCDKDKMSSMNLSGNTKEIWDLLVATGPELENPDKYVQCVMFKWNNESGQLWGCIPELVGEEEFCDYTNKTLMKNNYILSQCFACLLPKDKPCALRITWKERRCLWCQHIDCWKNPIIMNCNEKMSSMGFTGYAKNSWDLIARGSADLDDPDRYQICFRLLWFQAFPLRMAFLAGCGPKMVGNEEFCAYVNKTAAKNNSTMMGCSSHEANNETDLNFEQKRKCYVCEDLRCEMRPKIMDCNREKMTDYVYNFDWYLLQRTYPELDDPDEYQKCFFMYWRLGWHLKTIWGCAPAIVGLREFCAQMKTKFDRLITCRTCVAGEKPCFTVPNLTVDEAVTAVIPTATPTTFSWITTTTTTTAVTTTRYRRRINRATTSYDRVVLGWIISAVLLTVI